MGCKFCDLEEHESKNCKRYINDKERKEIADKKKFCRFCFIESKCVHLPEEKECKSNETCVGWYSTEHHTVFCPARIKAFKNFIPNIDKNLLLRFLDMFDMDEKYLMATSSPLIPEIINLKPVQIMGSFVISYSDISLDSDVVIVVNESMAISEGNNEKDNKLYNAIKSKSLISLSKSLSLFTSKLSSDMVLELLSTNTKKLYFNNSSCNPNISFADIIKKAPNLEEIYIYDFETNILNGNSWLNDLLEYSNTKNFQRLSIKVDAIEDIDPEKLAKLVRTKCASNVSISIQYDQKLMDTEDDGKAEWDKLDQIGQKLLKYFDDFFDLDSDDTDDIPQLKIGFDGVDGYQVFSLLNALKDE